MKQDIDFLKTLPAQPRQLPASLITMATIGLLALLTLISFTMALFQIRDSSVVEDIHAENIQVTQTFQKTAKLYPLLAGDTPLALQIVGLEKELQDKKNHYATLSRSLLNTGFSHYMETLIQVVPEGLWLSGVRIDQEKKSMSLSGYTTKPVHVSLFMQALQESPEFSETKFNLFYVKNMKDKAYTAFKITNMDLK